MKVGLDGFAQKALYEDYKRRLDAQAVLDHYGAERCSQMAGKDGTTEVIHSCLLDRVEPHHANGDANPSAACNLEKKLYVCYAYWSGDLFQLIMKMEGKDTLQGIIPILAQFLGDAVSDTDSFQKELDELFSKPSTYHEIDPPIYSPRILRPWNYVHPYLYEQRHIHRDAALKLQLGYDERENRIVFPHFWRGRLVGWQKRVIPRSPGQWPGTPDQFPKYKNSTGFPKSDTLYAYDDADKGQPVVCVESPMSVANAYSLGFHNTVSTFGAKVSAVQIDYLKAFREVIVWFDADPAGRSGEQKLVKGLYRHTRVKVVTPDVGKDLADYTTVEQIQEKLDSAQPAAFALASYDRSGRYG